jgi:dCMP deaminase
MTRQEKWDRFYLGLAQYYSQASKDPSTKVGAILVDPIRNRPVGWGYNGFPEGVADTVERLTIREVKYKLVVHAEANAILHAGRAARGTTLYVFPSFTLPPICHDCAKTAIQAGVQMIVGFEPDVSDPQVARWAASIDIAREMWLETGRTWRSYPRVAVA